MMAEAFRWHRPCSTTPFTYNKRTTGYPNMRPTGITNGYLLMRHLCVNSGYHIVRLTLPLVTTLWDWHYHWLPHCKNDITTGYHIVRLTLPLVTTLWDWHYHWLPHCETDITTGYHIVRLILPLVTPVQDPDNTNDMDFCMSHTGIGAWQTLQYNNVLYVREQPYRCWGMTDSTVQQCVVCQRAAIQV